MVARFSTDVPPEHYPRSACEGCPLGGPRVGSKGDPGSNLVLVGESPGQNECRTGVPFSGPSGEILHSFIPDGRAYVLNAMECSPRKSNKDYSTIAQAAHNCNARLVERITAAPRRLVVALGNAAVWSLTGNYHSKITQIRGQLIPSPLSELGILPVLHPAALMHGTGSYTQFQNDLLYALEMANGAPPRAYQKPKYIWPKTFKELKRELLKLLALSNDVSCDVETQGFNHRKHKIMTCGISLDQFQFPDTPVVCFDGKYLPLLRRYFESSVIRWCWHNGKFDVKFFWTLGIQARVDDDTLLMSYALDETRGIHGLEVVASDVLNSPDYKHVIEPYKAIARKYNNQFKTPAERKKKKQSPDDLSPHWFMWQQDPLGLMDYMSIDTGNTAKIRTIYRERVRSDRATNKLYTKTLIPASQLVAEIEYNGIHVDRQWHHDIHEIVRDELWEKVERVRECAGIPHLNPNSPQQMAKVLFGKFKLPDYAKGSTDKDVLKRWMNNASTRLPIVKALSEFRKTAKIFGTYIVGLAPHIHDDDRVYASFLLHGTITGRLASRDPNLQNIPRDWIIRGIFDAAPGYVLLEVDLSQAELRSLAALSGDPAMVELYRAGRDIHTELALALFPGWAERSAYPETTPEGAQAKEERTKCKNINFGIVYGITKYGLQDQMGDVTLDECQRMLDGWGDKFPIAWEFIERCRATPRNKQVITTHFGRKKRLGLVTRDNLGFKENEAANFPHQSTASDICLHAMNRSKDRLRKMGVRIVNLIHDAGLMEVPIHNGLQTLVDAATLVEGEMAQVPKDWGITAVPFLAESKFGDRWGSLGHKVHDGHIKYEKEAA